MGIVTSQSFRYLTRMRRTNILIFYAKRRRHSRRKENKMAFSLGQNTLKEIVDHFGLKHVRRLNIDIPVDGIVVITAEMYPEGDGVNKVLTIFKKYRLEEINE